MIHVAGHIHVIGAAECGVVVNSESDTNLIGRLLAGMDRVSGRLSALERRLSESPTSAQPGLLTLAEAQRWLSVGQTTLRKLERDGEIVFVRVGADPRVPLHSLQEYIRRHSSQDGNVDLAGRPGSQRPRRPRIPRDAN